MKNVLKLSLCVLLAMVLVVSIAACGKEEPEATKEPQLMVPATQPSYSDETTPIYTRPSDDGETTEPEEQAPTTNKGDGDGEQVEMHPDENTGNTGNTGTTTTPDDGEGEGEMNPDDGTSSNPDEDDIPDDSGSTGSDSGSNDDGGGFTSGTIVSTPKSPAKNLTWSNINSFAIKSSSMSTSQLRQLCVDFFRFAKTALWTPDESISYIRSNKGTVDSMTAGQLYGGLPYVGLSSGNVYRLMDYINESTGVVDMSDAIKITNGTMDMSALKYFGNQCANGAHVGWSRVINSVAGFATNRMTKNNGYIPIGPYTYDTAKIKNWSNKNGYRTSDVCRDNGEQVMYQSYAKLQIGDGLVYYTTAGHVIMASSAAHVEYTPGTDLIDGNKSYITIIDQAQNWESATASSGKTYQAKNSVDAKVTFKQLFGDDYVPFTLAEFQGTDPVEATTYSFSYSGSSATMSNLYGAKVTSNYAITDVYIIVTDASGNQVYKHAVRNSSAWAKSLTLAQSGANVDSWGELESGTYTVKVVAQLGTGERPTVYSGVLTV